MAVSTYTKSGAKATTPAKLDKKIFAVDVKNHNLLKSAYLAYLANGRDNLAITKKRGQVRGGGAKPWRQKGTGRARFGSSRNPIWRGGGVAFGPTGSENYSHKISTKAKREALRQALSITNSENCLKVIDSLTSSDGKTKPVLNILNKIEATGSVLLVVDSQDEKTVRSVKNLQNVKLVTARYLQVFDILNSDSVIITNDALAAVHEWLGGKNE
jgi:large subunit ribosomal protein L4